MAKGIHTELTFETAIEASLLESGGYVKGYSKDFDVNMGIFPAYILAFLKESQPKSWEKISAMHKQDVEQKVIQRLLNDLFYI